MEQEITLGKRQLHELDVIGRANDGITTVRDASEALGLSERQIRRLKAKVREMGAAGLIHGNRGRRPANRIDDATRAEILRLRALPEYAGSNFTHFRELLSGRHGIDVSYSSLRGMLTAAGIRSPKTRRHTKPHRRRKRKPQAGMLVQVDATPYAWFAGDDRSYELHGAIDDATGQLLALRMERHECLLGYFGMLKDMARNFGIPAGVYSDRHAIFLSPNSGRAELDTTVRVNDTQLGRCLRALGISLSCAHSPQAKGRVERVWGTLQSRLPVEFAIRGIRDMDAANAFLGGYVREFNARFAVEPEDDASMFAPCPPGTDLDEAFCVREERVVDAGGVFSYHGMSFAIAGDRSGYVRPHARVEVLTSPVFGIRAAYGGRTFEVLPFVPPKRGHAAAKAPKPAKRGRAAARTGPNGAEYREIGAMMAERGPYAESRRDIMDMLDDIFLGEKRSDSLL
jgi:transposase